MGRWTKNLAPKVEQTIDAICVIGCDVVSATIGALQNGELRREHLSLDEITRASLLQESLSILSVYQDKYR